MTRYLGDDYLEACDYLDRLDYNVMQMLKMSGIVKKPNINYELFEFGPSLVKKYQETIGLVVLGKFIRNHPEYQEKLMPQSNSKNTKNNTPSYLV